jgi:CMP-N-acetylneuraminic acid synthetase
MKILAIIAARGSSKGVKNKNIRDLAGKPLIVHTIEQLKQCGKYDQFIVSTDSLDIAAVVKEYGASVPFMRPDELAKDDTGKLDALRYALIQAEEHYGVSFDAVLDCDATAPIRTVEDIDNIVNIFKEKKCDCVFSVTKAHRNPYFNMVEQNSDGSVRVSKALPQSIRRRQDAPAVYDMNASMYVYSSGFLLDEKNNMPYSKKTFVYEMPDINRFDIDNEFDFKLIEFLVKEKIVNL